MMRAPGATGRVLCVGDVHGCIDELDRLLSAVEPGADDHLVFLGDYVDRGPASAATIARLIEIRKSLPRAVFLRGNHEEMFSGYLGCGGSHGEVFVRGGGAATLHSYGVASIPDGPATPEVIAHIPEEHVEFLRDDLKLCHAEAPWVFAHAGIRPGVPLAAQVADDLLWIREEFLCCDHGLDATVVFGHTPHSDVGFSPQRRIALDTGCVYGGNLSCLDLSEGLLYQVERGARQAKRRDVADEVKLALGL